MKMKLCDVCDCKKLCERIAQSGAKDITCREVRILVEEIIEKNWDEEEKNS